MNLCFIDFPAKNPRRTMMSNTVLLIIVTLTCVSNTTATELVCLDPIEIGELRVLKSKLCVDVAGGNAGSGNAETFRCWGADDQQIIWCGDGTIRNFQAPNNCLTGDSEGQGNLVFMQCLVYPAIPDYQKWRFGNSKTFVDNGGIRQVAREIINKKSGLCVDVTRHSGSGNIIAWHCDGRDDQYFYFRSRGKLLGYGRLQNEKSGLCLDPAGTLARRGENIIIYGCEDEPDQYFEYYENGELVNQVSRLCTDVKDTDGTGNIFLWDCEDRPDQMWSQPHQYCLGKYCSFVNKESSTCLDPAKTGATSGSNVATYTCQGASDQRFRWVTESWVTPTANWNLVGCNQNGKVTQTISNTVTYTSAISTSMAFEISSTIEAGVIFAKTELSTSVSTSLSHEWEESQSVTKEITFTCDYYDSGKEFTRGCMWQLEINTKRTTNEDPLNWSPLIVKCTSNNEAPKCPPFTQCKDDECTMCDYFPDFMQQPLMKRWHALPTKNQLKIE